MKKVMLIVALLLCLVGAGCQERTVQPRITAAFLGGANAGNMDDLDEGRSESGEYIGQLGIALGNTEMGLATHYMVFPGDETQTYGVYVKQLVLDPNGVPFVDKLYVGATAGLSLDEDGGLYGFMVGTSNKAMGIEFLTEFQFRTYNDALKALYGEEPDRYKIFVGPKIEF